MERLINMTKGTNFTAKNIKTGQYILCKKSGKNTIYVYTFHDCEGRTMGGYRDSIESFLNNHELV